MKHRTHKDFPSYRFYSDGRIMNKTTNHFIKVKRHMKLIDAKGKRRSITVQKYFAQLFPNLYTWDELCKAYNIPMGSIGYLLKKGKDNPNGQVIINIEKVIIKG